MKEVAQRFEIGGWGSRDHLAPWVLNGPETQQPPGWAGMRIKEGMSKMHYANCKPHRTL